LSNTQDRRFFLGFDQPPLVSACNWLVEFYAQPDASPPCLDLRDLIITLPTARAQSRLLQLLVREAENRDLLFTPPTMTTIGELPEHLYVAEKLLATDLAQQIAWSKALEATPMAEIKCLVGRPEVEELNDWQPLAKVLSQLHSRLANDIWSFSSVAREVKKIKGFLKGEAGRWDALKEIQKRYYEVLGNVDLWDRQAARNWAAYGLLLDQPEIRCRAHKKIVIVGAADLNRSLSQMLNQVSRQADDQVTVLVAAPPSMADRFDAFGSLITEKWLDVPIRLDSSQLLIVDQPADQAFAAVHYITNLDQQFASDEITIGVPDLSLVPQVERSLNEIGLNHRNLSGRALAETGPVRMMIACREYLRFQDYESFAALLRHPDVFGWVADRVNDSSWLGKLDKYQNENLPGNIGVRDRLPFGDPNKIRKNCVAGDESSEKRASRNAETAELLNEIHSHIAALLEPLVGNIAPIAEWTKPWSRILTEVYGQRLMDKNDLQDRQVIKACDEIYLALGNQKQVPPGFGTVVSSIQALDWAIEAAAENKVVPPPIPDAIELAGWLDLALDDAPVMVVTGMNDEHVPESQIGHPFLPNGLCEELGILDNNRRFARDAYALTVISSVRDHLLLIAGRRDEIGEPNKPSRLLFTEDHQSSALRAKAFFGYKGNGDSESWQTDQQAPATQQFHVPPVNCVSPPTSLTVTSFKEYLKCPYRFYLQKILKLNPLADDWRELSGGTFGDLIHEVLETFGKSEARDETDPDQIREFFDAVLDMSVKKRFAGSRLPAVRIQVEQLRSRLHRFSGQQAERRQLGWQIVSTEELLEHEWMIDGEPFVIRGKIDRVDRHEGTGRIAVWDYKSSDSGDLPGPAHLTRNGWKDLQLPLYRHLVKEVDAVKGADFGNLIMGYVLLPKNLTQTGFEIADWSPTQLQSADHVAIDVIRKIRGGIFWPPNPKPPIYSEDFAAICQDRVFERDNVWETSR
jgi:hypothetical protein